MGDNERLCAIDPHKAFVTERIPASRGLKPATPRSTGQRCQGSFLKLNEQNCKDTPFKEAPYFFSYKMVFPLFRKTTNNKISHEILL